MKPQRPKNVYLILMLGALIALSPFSIDMYLPAFPLIAKEFGIQVSELSLTLSGYFVGIAAGQLFYGPFLDRFGRKKPLYVGLVIYILATLGCITAHSLDELFVFRIVQGIGGCATNVAAIAMVRDFFEGKEGAKVFSLMILILGASPLLAPTTGSFFSQIFGWHSIFWILSGIGVLQLLMAVFLLPEGRAPDTSHSLKLDQIFKNYFHILKNPQFLIYTLAGSIAFSGLFVYLASSPVIFMEIFKVEPKTYGWIFGVLASGFIFFSQLNILFMRKYSSSQILTAGMTSLAIAGSIFCFCAYNEWLILPTTVLILFLYLSSAGIINPNAQALAMEPFTQNAGSASALMGFLSMAIGSIVSSLVGFVHSETLFPFTIIFAASACTAVVILILGKAKFLKS